MKPRRVVSLLTGVALLGAIARFNEMTPAARAALIDRAAATVRDTAQSWLHSTVVAYNEMTGAAAREPPGPAPAAPPPGTEGQRGDAAVPRHVVARTANGAIEPPSGNPLWALPLTQLSTTRDRPIFSPSRRPPPPPTPALVAPVAIRQPVAPPEPEHPAVSLLGTIIGTRPDDRIAVFMEAGTQNVVSLRIGEDHHGWVLRQVEAREVTLVKNGGQDVVLDLPKPGDAPPPGLGGPAFPFMPPGGPPQATPGIPRPPPTMAERPRRQPRR